MGLGIGLGLSLGQSGYAFGSAPPAFSPADLFLSSEPGVWGQAALADLWQDVARTTPVTSAGQPVGSWRLYTSSGVTYATQATAGARPTYEIDSNGRGRIQFGAGKRMQAPTITPGTDKVQAIITLSTVGTGTEVFLEMSPISDGNNGVFFLYQAVGSTRWRSKGTTAADATFLIPTPPDQYVLTGLGDISGDVSIIRKDGVQVGSNPGDQGTGNYLAYALNIGDRDGGGIPLLGAMYGFIVRFGPALSGPQLADAEAWASALRNP